MKIDIAVTARGAGWSGPEGTADVSVESQADLRNLPWEAICASLVQTAIDRYEEEVEDDQVQEDE